MDPSICYLFFCALVTFSYILWLCDLPFFWWFLSIIYFLHLLIYPQSEMKFVLSIMSRPNNSCTDVACNLVWYILCTEKLVAFNICPSVILIEVIILWIKCTYKARHSLLNWFQYGLCFCISRSFVLMINYVLFFN